MPTYDHDMTAMALSPHLNHFIECSDSEQTRFPGTIGRRNGVSRTRTHVKIMKQPTWPLNRHKLLSKAEVLSKKVAIWDTWAKNIKRPNEVFWSIKKSSKRKKSWTIWNRLFGRLLQFLKFQPPKQKFSPEKERKPLIIGAGCRKQTF